MSTTLFFNSTIPDWSRGEGDTDLLGNTVNWGTRNLLTTRGTSMAATGVDSTANPGETVGPGPSYEWVSPPLDRDVAISGNVVVNLWALEASMSANAWVACIIQRLDSKGAVQETVLNTAAIGSELGTSAAVRNTTLGATSTQFYKGDRIRVRVYYTDVSGTNMAAGYLLTFDFAGPTAAADGDSYLTFTEDFGFLTSSPDLGNVSQNLGSSSVAFGGGAETMVGQSFVAPADGTVTTIDIFARKYGDPQDNFVVALQADSGGSPSGTDLASASVAGTSISPTGAQTAFNIADTAISGGATYWIVARRSGSADGTNYYGLWTSTTVQLAPGGICKTHNGTTWSAIITNTVRFIVNVTASPTTLYLTNTASAVDPNGASYDAKEAWTSRGGGVQSASRAAVAGPTAPLLERVTEAGNYLEWFTKQLTAFTLSGLVACNIRATEVNAATNSAVRVEVAVCASDGTGPVVWGASNDGVETPVGEAAAVFLVAGDDTAVTGGQRLRIRVYFDDAPGVAMASGYNLILYYAGTSGGASGDSYITLPQVVTEYTGGGGASVTTPSIARTKTIGVPTISAVRNVSLTPTAVGRASIVGAPTTRGAAGWTTTALARPAVVGAPTVSAIRNVSISTASLGRLAVVGASTITAVRHVSISLTGIARIATVTVPTTRGAAGVSRPALTGIATIGLLTTRGAASIVPTAVVGTVVVPTPTVEAGTGAVNADVHPNAVVVLKTIAATPVVGNANAPPVTVAASATTQIPSLSGGAGVTSPSVVRAAAVSTPTIATSRNVSITVTAAIATTAVTSPSLQTGVGITAAATIGSATVGAPTPSGSAGITTPALARTATVGAPVHSSTVQLVPPAVVRFAVVPSPTVEAGGVDANVSFLDRPLNLVATAFGSGEIDLSWNAVTGATTYAIKRDGVVIVPSHGSTSYADTNVDPATTYSYRVKGRP